MGPLRGNARCSRHRAPSPGRARRGGSDARRRAAAGWRRGSTRSGRDRDRSTPREVPWGIDASRWRRSGAPRGGPSARRRQCAMPATRRHSVGPPDHDESKLQKSIAPSTIRSRQPAAENSLWPAQTRTPGRRTGRRALRAGRCARRTAPRTSRGRVVDRAREAHRLRPASIPGSRRRTRMKSGAGRVARVRESLGVCVGVEAADLELHARQAHARAGSSTSWLTSLLAS